MGACPSPTGDNDPVAVTGVSLDKTTLILGVGKTAALTATVSPADASDPTLTWSSSNNDVATVSGGTVTAVAAGTAVITARSVNDKTADCTVTVKTLSSISVSGMPNKTAYYPGEVLELEGITVTAHWNDSTTSNLVLGDVTAAGFDASAGTHTGGITVSYGGKDAILSGYTYTVSNDNYTFASDSAPGTLIPVEITTGVLDLAVLETYMNTASGAHTLTLYGNVGADGNGTAGSYTLNGAGKQLTITSGGTTTRHIYKSSATGIMFNVQGGAKLILDGHVTLHGIDNNNAPLVRVDGNNSELVLKGHVGITGNTNNSGSGGGVFVHSSATFTMGDNAKVSNNTAIRAGGGVFLERAFFTMRDTTTVSGNTAQFGGGVTVAKNATFTMQGNAVVSGNSAVAVNNDGGSGGGVFGYGTFIMEDTTTVLGNTASQDGGGVNLSGTNDTTATFIMKGGAKISGNTAAYGGGGAFIWNGGTCRIASGTVYGYTAGDPNSNMVKNAEGTILNNRGAALVKGALGTAEYGSFSGDTWTGAPIPVTDNGNSAYRDTAVKVVGGVLQP